MDKRNLNEQRNSTSKLSRTKLLCTMIFLLMILLVVIHFWPTKNMVMDFDEIPYAIRVLLRCDNELPPQYTHYKTIQESKESRITATGRSNSGEIYISKGHSVRSENLFVTQIRISTIDQEQFYSYDWCVRVSDDEDCIKLVPISYFFQEEIQSGYGTFLIVLPKDKLKSNNLEAEIYGGIESNDGKKYDILRCGKVNLDIPDYVGTLLPEYSLAIQLIDNNGDNLGDVSSIEVSDGYAILKIDVPLLADIHDEDEMLLLQNSIYACLNNPTLNFNNGSQFRISYGYNIFLDNRFYMIKELPDAYNDRILASITVSGQEYSLFG